MYVLRYYLQSFNIWYTKTSNCKLNFTLQNIVYWMNYFSVDKKTRTFDPKVLPPIVWAGYALTIRINCIIMLSGMQLSLTIPHNLIICSMIKFEAKFLWICFPLAIEICRNGQFQAWGTTIFSRFQWLGEQAKIHKKVSLKFCHTNLGVIMGAPSGQSAAHYIKLIFYFNWHIENHLRSVLPFFSERVRRGGGLIRFSKDQNGGTSRG